MASSDPGSVDRKVLDDLYEDIHWLILVSGQQRDINLFFLELSQKGHFKGFEVWKAQSLDSVGMQDIYFWRG